MKMKIIPLSDEDFSRIPDNLDIPRYWKERDYQNGLNPKCPDLIKEISEKEYNGFHIENVNKIEDINKDVPVYLDNIDNNKETIIVELKKEELEEHIKKINNEIERLKESGEKDSPRLNELSGLLDNFSKIKEDNKQNDIIRYECQYSRPGYYTRQGKEHNPEIVLLMGNIGDDKTLLISTYVHEMFHAYYDWDWIKNQNDPNYKKQEDLKYIEEPLTEYAMLKFLEDFVGQNGDRGILNDAAEKVRKKQLASGICYYGFGYYLWKWEQEGNKPLCDWIQCYKKAKFKIGQSQYKDEFVSTFKKGLYPIGEEHDYMELLSYILTGTCVSNRKCNMEEKESKINKIGVEHYNLIQFGGRSFFVPLQFHNTIYVSDDGNKLEIDFEGGAGAYCLVNGIRCSEVVSYNKKDDMVFAFVEEYTMNGVQCTSPISVGFKFDDREIVYGRSKSVVIPQRHYDELASSFLSENPQLDSRIHDFLQKHPECFGSGPTRGDFPPNYVNEWNSVNNHLTLRETDEEYCERVDIEDVSDLEDDVLQLFCKEELGA